MVNMSYCKFENTYKALIECINHVNNGKETSPQEIEYAKKLYKACDEFISDIEYDGLTDEEGELVEICD